MNLIITSFSICKVSTSYSNAHTVFKSLENNILLKYIKIPSVLPLLNRSMRFFFGLIDTLHKTSHMNIEIKEIQIIFTKNKKEIPIKYLT